MTTLKAGKLPPALLTASLRSLPTSDPQLQVGPAVGEDAAVIDFAASQGQLLVVKSDPITFATDEIGYYAVNVCVNDLAVSGALPRFYLPTILLPAGATDVALVQQIFAQIGDACRHLDIVIAGGHSEITPAVNQPVVAGTLLGEVPRGHVVRSSGARPGDQILLAGVAPIEGVSIIARERRTALLAQGWLSQELDVAAGYLHDPGISVLQPARFAVAIGGVTAMHDPTEGGVATGLLEIAIAADVGLSVDLDAIPIPDLAQRLCHAFGLDPLGTIASGALLATVTPNYAQAILKQWRAQGWPAAHIGEIAPKGAGLTAHRQGRVVDFPTFATDEITKLWT